MSWTTKKPLPSACLCGKAAHCSHLQELDMQKLLDRYNVYVACAESLGWPIKSFEEWLNS